MKSSDTAKRILDAATTLFLRHGYGRTNLEQVASLAGVTKPTVYSHFRSKRGLLQAMTRSLSDQRVAEFETELRPEGNPRQELTRFAERFLSGVMSDEARAWQRLAFAESGRHPEVGQAFFEAGPSRVYASLTAYLKEEKRAGRLNLSNPERAAEQFLGLLLGLDLLRSLVGQPKPTEAHRKRRCRETVNMFLAAYESGTHPVDHRAEPAR